MAAHFEFEFQPKGRDESWIVEFYVIPSSEGVRKTSDEIAGYPPTCGEVIITNVNVLLDEYEKETFSEVKVPDYLTQEHWNEMIEQCWNVDRSDDDY